MIKAKPRSSIPLKRASQKLDAVLGLKPGSMYLRQQRLSEYGALPDVKGGPGLGVTATPATVTYLLCSFLAGNTIHDGAEKALRYVALPSAGFKPVRHGETTLGGVIEFALKDGSYPAIARVRVCRDAPLAFVEFEDGEAVCFGKEDTIEPATATWQHVSGQALFDLCTSLFTDFTDEV